jgi:hypothetical protein
MVFTVFYNRKEYELPESMRCLGEHQDDSMKTDDGIWRDALQLSHLEFINVSNGQGHSTNYSLFVGVADTVRDSIIIIYGEYDSSYDFGPYKHGSFNYIEVPKSEMIEFDDQPSKFILQVGKHLCAIVLKSELIVIGITQDFLEDLDEPLFDDDYDEHFSFFKRIEYERKITDFPFVRSSTCGPAPFDEIITSGVEKKDDGCEIVLCFTWDCRNSSEITNEITISFSDEQIKISYDMKTTTYEQYVSGGEYNDDPTMSTDKREIVFNRETTINLFPEEEDD